MGLWYHSAPVNGWTVSFQIVFILPVDGSANNGLSIVRCHFHDNTDFAMLGTRIFNFFGIDCYDGIVRM